MSSTGQPGPRVLVVEDEFLIRMTLAEALGDEGFDVVEAADGSEGAALYAVHCPFDLVLLDLNLPFLSGVDVCRRIKAMRPHQPVLICSAAILDYHVDALRELNVDQFLTKPYHPLELLERIGNEIGRSTDGRGGGPDAGHRIPGHRGPAAAAGDRAAQGLFRPHRLG
jgi:DNA-binding response OmpR family regulator